MEQTFLMQNNTPFIIAIDGTAGSGKGTLSKRLAKHFGYVHLDTGKLYRATAYKVIKNGGDIHNVTDALDSVKTLEVDDFSNPELTSNDIGNGASIVSKIPEVRQALVAYQHNFPNGNTGAVIDGRDIGTVIFPDANIKFFVDADVTVRAERRTAELKSKELQSTEVNYDTILTDLKARDQADKNRAISPLVPAQDAHHIDTSKTDIQAMLEYALSKF